MISVTIITKNEERNIARCLKSVDWADEIIIVDSGSTDSTIEICKRFNCKIIQTEWRGFGKTKQLGVEACSNEWILSIDADEEVSTRLKDEILKTTTQHHAAAYTIKRNSYYLTREIKHSGWNNDYPLRLFLKRNGQFNDESVHESIIITNGVISTIHSPLLHYPYPTIEHHIRKINLYTTLGATKYFNKNKKSSILYAIISGAIKFIKMYILKKGFLDGKEGFILCTLSSYGSFIKYIKLWEINTLNHTKASNQNET